MRLAICWWDSPGFSHVFRRNNSTQGKMHPDVVFYSLGGRPQTHTPRKHLGPFIIECNMRKALHLNVYAIIGALNTKNWPFSASSSDAKFQNARRFLRWDNVNAPTRPSSLGRLWKEKWLLDTCTCEVFLVHKTLRVSVRGPPVFLAGGDLLSLRDMTRTMAD